MKQQDARELLYNFSTKLVQTFYQERGDELVTSGPEITSFIVSELDLESLYGDTNQQAYVVAPSIVDKGLLINMVAQRQWDKPTATYNPFVLGFRLLGYILDEPLPSPYDKKRKYLQNLLNKERKITEQVVKQVAKGGDIVSSLQRVYGNAEALQKSYLKIAGCCSGMHVCDVQNETLLVTPCLRDEVIFGGFPFEAAKLMEKGSALQNLTLEMVVAKNFSQYVGEHVFLSNSKRLQT